MTEDLSSIIEDELPHEIMERLLSISKAPFAIANGVEPLSIKRDEVRLRMPMKDKQNSLNVGHGAATFLLADHTLAYASNMGPEVQVAICCHISYLRPVRGDVLTSLSRCVHDGRSSSLYEVQIFDGDELVAVMQGTGHKLKG
ncbi:MAG: PaaI family thioesterase [Candidatus Methanomethylophilaceae archaeon]|jgi:acyl-CoA thioesterase